MNTTTQTTDYEQKAIDFLQKTNTSFSAKYLRNGKHWEDDKDHRDIYEIKLKRGSRSYAFTFGQSIMNSQYYQDPLKGRTYTLNGGCRTGNYKITDIEKYKNSFGFGKGLKLVKGEAPTPYDVLSCLTKYDPGTFEDFCGEFGYDTDSRKAEKTYKAVCEEYTRLCTLFTPEEMEEMQDIN